MTTASSASTPQQRGTLDDFLSAEEIGPLPELSDRDWDAVRRAGGLPLVLERYLGNVVATVG